MPKTKDNDESDQHSLKRSRPCRKNAFIYEMIGAGRPLGIFHLFCRNYLGFPCNPQCEQSCQE